MLKNVRNFFAWPWLFGIALILMSGCAEGPMWRTGYLSPWARQQWANEEKIAPTLFSKKQELQQIAERAKSFDSAKNLGSPQLEASQREAAQRLADVAKNDEIVLLRIEAIELLGNFANEISDQALRGASFDRNPEIRKAAVKAMRMRNDAPSLESLSQIVAREADVDVKLLAIEALSQYDDPKAALAIAPLLSNRDPAVQFRVAESLGNITGKSFGSDIQAWQRYVNNTFGTSKNTQTATAADSLSTQ